MALPKYEPGAGRPVSVFSLGSLDLSDPSGADIAAVCRKALEFTISAFDRGDRETVVVTRPDIQRAVEYLQTESCTENPPEFH